MRQMTTMDTTEIQLFWLLLEEGQVFTSFLDGRLGASVRIRRDLHWIYDVSYRSRIRSRCAELLGRLPGTSRLRLGRRYRGRGAKQHSGSHSALSRAVRHSLAGKRKVGRGHDWVNAERRG